MDYEDWLRIRPCLMLVLAFVFGFFVCVLLTWFITVPFIDKDCFVINNSVTKMDQHNASGIYDPVSGVYCVHTKGRSAKAIQTTEYHEACHSFIDNEYEHFCVKSTLPTFKYYCGEYSVKDFCEVGLK